MFVAVATASRIFARDWCAFSNVARDFPLTELLLFPNPPPPTAAGTRLRRKLINNRSRDFMTSQDKTDHEDVYVNGKISKGISIGNGQGGGTELHKIVRSHSAQV
jgi:hypothetical protein